MKFKSALFGGAAAAAMLTTAGAIAPDAEAASITTGSVLNLANVRTGDVVRPFSGTGSNLLDFRSGVTGDGQRVNVTTSTGSFTGANLLINQSPPPPRIRDVTLTPAGVNSFNGTPINAAGDPISTFLSGIDVPGVANNIRFRITSFVYNALTGDADFTGGFFNGNTLLANGTGKFTSQLGTLLPGNTRQSVSSYSLSITAVAIPTPALLPGLVGIGVAAFRRRRAEKAIAQEAKA